MDSRQEVLTLVNKLGYRELDSFVRDMSEVDNCKTLGNGWSLKWNQEGRNLQAINFGKKMAYVVCFFAGCEFEVSPGNYCEHFSQPITFRYSQQSQKFNQDIKVAMKKLGIPVGDAFFGYNALINYLKNNEGKPLNCDDVSLRLDLNSNSIVLLNKNTGKATMVCGLPGCYIETMQQRGSLYCFKDRGLQRSWRRNIQGNDVAVVFEQILKDMAQRIGEVADQNNTSGWMKILQQFVCFEEFNQYTVIHQPPGDRKPSDIQIVFHLTGQLEMYYRGLWYGICNQPFCGKTTENNKASKQEVQCLKECAYRCMVHQKDASFSLDSQAFIEIFTRSAKWASN